MAYQERGERDMDLDNPNGLYEEDLYEDYGYTDTFGERIDNSPTQNDDDLLLDDEALEDDMAADTTEPAPATKVEEGFGESISPDSNPHLNDQLEDTRLNEEAEKDYSSEEDKSLIDKAKDKINEITGKDEKQP